MDKQHHTSRQITALKANGPATSLAEGLELSLDASCIRGSCGGWELKNPLAWTSFFKFFWQFKQKRRPGTFVTFALRLYNSYNHAHEPNQHMWPSPGPWPDSTCSQTGSEQKPCQGKIATDEIQEKKIIESTAIEKERVSVHWLAQCHVKWPRAEETFTRSGNQTRAAILSATDLNH